LLWGLLGHVSSMYRAFRRAGTDIIVPTYDVSLDKATHVSSVGNRAKR